MDTCQICGMQTTNVKLSRVWLHQFGNRSQVERFMCRSCRKAESEGNL
jgi:hypothetical protein